MEQKVIEHRQALGHCWDLDEEAKNFVCSTESLHFSPRALHHVTCVGCEKKVPVELVAKHAARWQPKAAKPGHNPEAWLVDKVFNEVVNQCACMRCRIRRRRLPSYAGLEPKKKEKTAAKS